MYCFVFITYDGVSRETELERHGEREGKIERQRVCVCLFKSCLCNTVTTLWFPASSSSLLFYYSCFVFQNSLWTLEIGNLLMAKKWYGTWTALSSLDRYGFSMRGVEWVLFSSNVQWDLKCHFLYDVRDHCVMTHFGFGKRVDGPNRKRPRE